MAVHSGSELNSTGVIPPSLTTKPNLTFLDGYLRREELARQLGVSARTIDRWQSLRCGPQRVAVGRTILYSLDSVRQWLESREQAKSVDRKRRLFCPAVPLVRGPGFSMLGN
jgi:predicted DNA-binding transcriptional regulator AlpA